MLLCKDVILQRESAHFSRREAWKMNTNLREDNKIVRIIEYISELFILNMLTLLCCLPVITAGSSVTAMHTVLQKMVRHEGGYIVKPFFSAFRENFRQATLIWLLFLAILLPAGIEILAYMYAPSVLPRALVIIAASVAIFMLMFLVYVFPLQARFKNDISGTLKLAMTLAAARFPRTLLMTLLCAVPAALAMFGGLMILPFVFLYGFSLPGFLCAKIYDPVFRELE